MSDSNDSSASAAVLAPESVPAPVHADEPVEQTGEDQNDNEENGAGVEADAPETPSRGRPARERKSVQRLSLGDDSASQDFKVEPGKGTPLGEIDNIKRRMDSLKASAPELIRLYSICFNRRGTKEFAKKHLVLFSGFMDQEARERANQRIESMSIDVPTLKAICSLLDQSISGTKAELMTRIIEFLDEPKSTGKEYTTKAKSGAGSSSSASKKRKSTGSNKKKGAKKSKSSGEKKPLTPFFVFMKRHRAEVQRNNQGISLGEVSKLLGERWRSMSDAEKDRYRDDGSESDESGEETGDSESDDAPPSPPPAESPSHLLGNTIRGVITEILKKSDLSAWTLRAVREQLVVNPEIGEANVEKYKEWINDVTRQVASKFNPQ